ncbi:MAG: phosphomannomutase/phosphoglucomutase [Planctomycetes bacterium]|nr:phosphomannomutase/phosphoglucomutase [Planctomycetota bacterium]MCB9904265.1 phosphomannomutase/phosphoglucomutase [Planctomycetota bacterium]
MAIFKAYDIRGLYPQELDLDTARKIGHAFTRLLGAERLLVGQDMRTHSPEVADAVIEGMLDAGAEVLDVGLASTPMVYYAIGSHQVDGGLVVTASHNPGEYNGMKLCGKGATPISRANGIADIERMCAEPYPGVVGKRGERKPLDLLAAYADHVASFCTMDRPVRIAIDAANGMAGYTLPAILERLPLVEAKTMLMEPDGTFPAHEANPIKEENLDPVRLLVQKSVAQLGVGFDGDADRCCFVDENGVTVSADLMTALLARQFLKTRPGSPIVYDLRSSWVVKEEIERAGGVAIRDRVGHSFIKATMREKGAVFAGELSGHFYFGDNFTTDSGVLAMVSALNLLGSSASGGKTLSQLTADLRRYHATGEVNFKVADKDAAIAELKSRYADGRQDELDGITVEYGDLARDDWWWFNVRASNTEPFLRLNLEARTAALRDARRDELIAILGEPAE